MLQSNHRQTGDVSQLTAAKDQHTQCQAKSSLPPGMPTSASALASAARAACCGCCCCCCCCAAPPAAAVMAASCFTPAPSKDRGEADEPPVAAAAAACAAAAAGGRRGPRGRTGWPLMTWRPFSTMRERPSSAGGRFSAGSAGITSVSLTSSTPISCLSNCTLQHSNNQSRVGRWEVGGTGSQEGDQGRGCAGLKSSAAGIPNLQHAACAACLPALQGPEPSCRRPLPAAPRPPPTCSSCALR